MTETNSQAKQEVDFPDTPHGWGQRWKMEIDWAKRALKEFHEEGDEVVRTFRGEETNENKNTTRLPIYTQNVKALEAHLRGRVPKVQVTRRYADAADDAGRVAAEMVERHLNADIEDDSDSFDDALRNAIKDFLQPGIATIRLLYSYKAEPVTGPDGEPVLGDDGEPQKTLAYECAESRYVYWKDFLWSPCKTWADVRWTGEALYFTRRELIEEFGEEIGKVVPLDAGKPSEDDKDKESPWSRARIWEIWDKATRQVFWISESYATPLRTKPDPLGLKRFFPYPRPMMANLATDKMIPRAEFMLAKSLYAEIDLVSTRITSLERAVRVAGGYDATNAELKDLLSDKSTLRLFPITNWASLAQQGGFKGVIDWFPLDMVVGALDTLRGYRAELIQLADQITGMSDIQRGTSDGAGTAREALIKQANASIRVRAMEDEVARFASDAMRIKFEIIAKHYDEQTLVQKANMLATVDKALVPQAVRLIKSQWVDYRIEIKPEAVNMTDFASLRSERTELIQAASAYMQAMAPLAQSMPGSTPFLLQVFQWAIAGYRGSSQIEGVLDQAIQMSQQAAQNPQQQKPDPKVQAAQMKAQGEQMKHQAEMQKIQVSTQADLAKIAAQSKAKGQEEATQAFWAVEEERAKAKIKADAELAKLGLGGSI